MKKEREEELGRDQKGAQRIKCPKCKKLMDSSIHGLNPNWWRCTNPKCEFWGIRRECLDDDIMGVKE